MEYSPENATYRSRVREIADQLSMLALSISVEVEHAQKDPDLEVESTALITLSFALDQAADMAARCNSMMEEEPFGN